MVKVSMMESVTHLGVSEVNEVISDAACVTGNLKSNDQDKEDNGPWRREPAYGASPVHSIIDYHLRAPLLNIVNRGVSPRYGYEHQSIM